ncbi:hypothetical protein BJX99DRAFT_259691 [Aspergillus californicus]
MRFLFSTLLMALFTIMAAANRVECAGKAIMTKEDDVKDSVKYMDKKIKKFHDRYTLSLDGGRCTKNDVIYCKHNTLVTMCNLDRGGHRQINLKLTRDGVKQLMEHCQSEYKGKKVTGGVYYNDDEHLSVIVQDETSC